MFRKSKRTPRKIMSIITIFAMLFSYFGPILNVFAVPAETTHLSVSFRDNSADYGIVQYSLNDGADWNDITEEFDEDITVTGENLRLKLVPNNGGTVDYTGIELDLDETNYKNLSNFGFQSENGYSVPADVANVSLTNVEFRGGLVYYGGNTTSKVTVSVSGEELEYNNPWSDDACDFIFGINNAGMRRLTKDEVNFTTEDEIITGLTTKNEIDYQYNYNNEGTVTFNIKTQWDDVITSLKINDVPYNTPQTKEELTTAFDTEFRGIRFDIENVPYEETYNIEVIGRKQTSEEKIMGNFGWSYDPNSNEYSDDDKIPYGNLEFVRAVYNNQVYDTVDEVNAAGKLFEWNDGVKGTDDPTGEAMFPTGTELTIRLIPDSGYQLTSFDLNGFPFEPGEEAGLYTFTIGGGNWHLGAHFTEVNDEVQTNSESVKSGNIEINKAVGENFENGTAKLEVSDSDEISYSREEAFTNAITEDDFEIEHYFDISLYNTIYKAGLVDENNNYESWDNEVNNLEEKARITLELEDNMNGKDVVLVHETHDGNTITGYEEIGTIYNAQDNTITFETDSFSTYALASRKTENYMSNEEKYTVSDDDGNEISFTEEAGHTYHLSIVDYLSYTKEEIMSLADVTSEEYDQVFDAIRANTKKYGDLIAFYEIDVFDENDHYIHEGPFKIKIKMTDKMKKYNTFKIMYLNDDLSIGDPITLKVEGVYLVGTIDHLSKYVLTGSNTSSISSTTNNPQTGDNISTWIFVLLVSSLGLALGLIAKPKLKKSKIRY
ncbi:MAG: hypothetical protein E7160_00070 [Firmicutes bacterium]|nr:hypothetical protein [Bacillota bacterium]